MRTLVAGMLAGLLIATRAAFADNAGSLEIRFCPATQVRAYPLESRRDVQSLLLQNAAIVNRSPDAAELTAVDFELVRDGATIDARHAAGEDLARAAAGGAAMQQAGMLKLLAFQFCGLSLIGEELTLAGPTLAPAQALLIAQQPFAYRGRRDSLRVRVHARVSGRDVEVAASLPIVTGVAQTKMSFPLRGSWFVAVGPTMHTAHRWALPEEFGYDIVSLGTGNRSHRSAGAHFADYFAYGAPVLAAADGVVAAALDGEPENAAMLRGAGESDAAYAARVQNAQDGLLARGARGIAGNSVVIDHGNREYSVYAHLQPGSVRVHAGDRVLAGTPIGRLGSSGNSTEPHLHFQVCDAPAALACAGIPVEFQNLTLPFADYPRALQSGDVVIAR